MRFHTIPLLLFSLTAFAGPAIQFCADRPQKVAGGSSGVAAWTSMDGKWSLVPVHTNDIGWCAPSYSARQVRFGVCETNTVSPLQFPASATTLVSRAFLVANGTNATSLATLLDAPVPLRLFPRFFAGGTWYLGLKWSLPFDFETPENTRALLAQLGVKSDPLFSSIILAR